MDKRQAEALKKAEKLSQQLLKSTTELRDNLQFQMLKSQEQINREARREKLILLAEDIGGAFCLFALAIALLTVPYWMPILSSWWAS